MALAHNLFGMTESGVVTGILYTIENTSINSSAIIDGQVLREGDVIYGVKVVKVNTGIVEFEKNGKRWKQRVRERANTAWKEPD